MAARKTRTFTPNAYTRPDVEMKPRPSIEPRPTMGTAYAKIVCTSTPSGAKVTLSSQTMRYASELGVTPVTTTVGEGVYTVVFTKGGYKPVNKSVMLKPGDTRYIKVNLTPSSPVIIPVPILPPPEKAKLICNTTPQGAEVTVSATGISAYLGGTAPCTLMLEPNVMYTLTFKKEGLKPTYKKYSLKPGEVRIINVTLPLPYVPVPPTPPPAPLEQAKLICKSTPSGASVTIYLETMRHAIDAGVTPVTVPLKEGIPYTVVFTKGGCETVREEGVILKPGETKTINVTLPLPYFPIPPEIPDIEPPSPPPDIEPEPEPEPTPPPPPPTPPDIEPVPPVPPPTPPEVQKIDVISFTTAPSCVIGDICKGEMVLQNNTDAVLEGAINITMEGAVPVVPVVYAIPAQSTETVAFEIPTVGLTIIGAYTLELDMLMNEEVVESQRSRVEILPVDEYEITITSEPSTAKVVVTEL